MEVRAYARAIVKTVREPLLFLNKELEIICATNAFYKCFGLNDEEVEGSHLHVLSGALWTSSPFESLLRELDTQQEIKDWQLSGGSEEETFLVNAARVELEKESEKVISLSFKKVGKSRKHLQDFKTIFAETPAMIAILRGPQHVFELANQQYLQLTGNRNIIGKSIREAIPEVGAQGYFEVLDKVYTTGETYIGNETPVELQDKNGELRKKYLNFVFQPFESEDGRIERIFIHAVDVTEQVLTRKTIEKTQEELRDLIDTVPAIIWIANREASSRYLNRSWYNYTGQSPRESEHLGWAEAVHPGDREQALNSFLSATRERREFNDSFRLRIRDGSYRWVLNQGRPKWDGDGKFEGMIGAVVDVHEEKVKEQLLKEQEHRLRTIVEEATVATAVFLGREMKIELANEAMLQMWGKKKSIIGSSFHDALPELRDQPFFGQLRQVYDSGETYWGKEERGSVIKDDELVTGYFNYTFKPLRDKNGQIYGILIMSIDVTEMVESKMQLKKSEVYFRQMADFMPDKVARADAEGNFLYFNRHWLSYTGMSMESMKQQGWAATVHPDDKNKFFQVWNRSLDTGENFEMELRCRDKNGKYHWHLSRAEAVKGEGGKIRMWISTNTEIQKIKEEEKRKGDFLKMVSHELKTPVTSMKGYVQLLLKLVQHKKEVQVGALPLQPSLERIDHQISRLTRLISEMLDLSRIEENKLELQKTRFLVNDLVVETVQDIGYTNTQHKINVVHNCNCEVYADRDRIGQVLINLITNAIKYSPESHELQVRVEEATGGRVALRVRDYGIGIDKKDQARIFERFYRIGGEDQETYSGFGIGLFVAREIVNRHNGTIEVKSTKGEGSEFSFTLPAGKNLDKEKDGK